jgi:hypothetical protein
MQQAIDAGAFENVEEARAAMGLKPLAPKAVKGVVPTEDSEL